LEKSGVVEIVFVIRGRETEIDALENRTERAALREVAHSLRVRLAGVECAVHKTGPRITASGDAVDFLAFDLAGCCQKLIDQTLAALR
jgi:hypothetical protein